MNAGCMHRCFALGAALAALAAPGAFAQPASTGSGQAYPSRPIELVVHTSAGGGTDLFARVVAEIMTREKLVNQPINVVNRTGGGGAIAYTYIKTKRGEPHTVMTVATLALLTQTLRPELEISLDHYTPIAFLAQDPQAVMVSADSPHKTFKELIEASKRDPSAMVASVTSPGGSGRLLGWLIERATGARFKAVSFKSGADAILQVMGNHTHVTFENISEGYAAVEARKLRVLAVTVRQADIKQIPTVADTFPDFSMLGSIFLLGPAKIPADIAQRINASTDQVVKDPKFNEQLKPLRWQNLEGARSLAGTVDYIRVQRERWAKFISETGRKPE
jgi:tripartite-type tricarboxylate transporter receptor subunit TctC